MTEGPRRRAADRRFGEALVSWFRGAARDLPWRRARTPWRVWVSEVMLQQTTVETATPAFERFLARFPDVESMARSDASEVVAAWSGLGYYRRARMLHRGARAAVLAGGVPSTYAGLRALPGVGPYTAGAVASLAFGEAAPAIDGNAARVLSRFEALDADPASTRGRRALEALATALMPPDAAGAFNEGLIELGATVCRPAAPRCEACPWSGGCLAFERGETDRFPRKRPRPTSIAVRSVRAWVRRGARTLVVRRPDDAATLPGFDELPGRRLEGGESVADAVRAALAPLGVRVVSVAASPCARARHVITRYRIGAEAYETEIADDAPLPSHARFATEAELRGPRVTTETRKLAAAAGVAEEARA
ncbi:MAG TPA: A/G-specific adenine glycosylase [Planctomycetota bacterium]|nr:A/G-specific adenine glycosylase [Planctomycetota bacterium]